jgi:aminopeptidase YwaD
MCKISFLSAVIFCLSVNIVFSQESQIEEALQKHLSVLASDSLEGRCFGFVSKQKAIDYIVNEFKKNNIKPLADNYLQSFVVQLGMTRVEGFNIVGCIEGSDPILKNEYIVLGAHFDHVGFTYKNGQKIIYNGADDNASGVGALLEIGKYLSVHRNELKRSVLILAFDGEESGLLGSHAFASSNLIDFTKIKAMFSLDMVGMYKNNNGVDLNGICSIIDGEKIAREAASQLNVKINKTEKKIEGRTDTWSFAEKGIPAVHVFTGYSSPYHKPEDDYDLLDYPGMTKITTLLSEITLKLAGEPDLKDNTKFIKHQTDPVCQVGFSINTGYSYHFYNNQYFMAKPILAFSVGPIVQFKLTDNISLLTKVLYETYGSKSETGNFREHSISPELNALLLTPFKANFMPRLFAMAGVYYKYNFAGKAGGATLDFDQTQRFDLGLNLGVGIRFMNFQLGYYLQRGFENINSVSDDKITNRSNYY